MSSVLETALSNYPTRSDVMNKFKLSLTAQQRLKGFTEAEDKFLLWLARECGCGEWSRMHQRILVDPQFSFDYWLITRAPVDLERRCTSLIGMLERDGQSQDPDAPTKKRKRRTNKEMQDERDAARKPAEEQPADDDMENEEEAAGKKKKSASNKSRGTKRSASPEDMVDSKKKKTAR